MQEKFWYLGQIAKKCPESNVLPKPETWTSSAYFTRSDNYQLLETSETIEKGQTEHISLIQSIT